MFLWTVLAFFAPNGRKKEELSTIVFVVLTDFQLIDYTIKGGRHARVEAAFTPEEGHDREARPEEVGINTMGVQDCLKTVLHSCFHLKLFRRVVKHPLGCDLF